MGLRLQNIGGSSGKRRGAALRRSFFRREPVELAQALIGCTLAVDGVGGEIVETEAYDASDPASHCYQGRRTERNASMFGAPAHAYVYRSYGIHWCLNFVAGHTGGGSAVLIRALRPLWGLEQMAERRGSDDERLLCCGPGRLCQALGIDKCHDGADLSTAPFELRGRAGVVDVLVGTRIGITRAQELPWRFGLAGSRYLSRPFARPSDAD